MVVHRLSSIGSGNTVMLLIHVATFTKQTVDTLCTHLSKGEEKGEIAVNAILLFQFPGESGM